MTGDCGFDQLCAVYFLARNGALLVSLHKARVTDHVGGENCREPALHVSVPLRTQAKMSMDIYPLKRRESDWVNGRYWR